MQSVKLRFAQRVVRRRPNDARESSGKRSRCRWGSRAFMISMCGPSTNEGENCATCIATQSTAESPRNRSSGYGAAFDITKYGEAGLLPVNAYDILRMRENGWRERQR